MPTKNALYNEIEAFPAQWLRNLIKGNMIAKGDVDERDIRELKPKDLEGYAQFHAFAGVGVWSYALKEAGWPNDRPVWTGSAPCQPFSSAGKRGGTSDPRHLWPTWYKLIKKCKPPVIFGEQVSSGDGLAWLDIVQADLEKAGYTVQAFDLCAAGFGAPHKRQRLFFVAVSKRERRKWGRGGLGGSLKEMQKSNNEIKRSSVISNVAHPEYTTGARQRTNGGEVLSKQEATGFRPDGEPNSMADTRRAGLPGRKGEQGDDGTELQAIERGRSPTNGFWADGELGDPTSGKQCRVWERRTGIEGGEQQIGGPGPVNGFWADAEWIYCRDGKYRAVEPGTSALAPGTARGVGRMRPRVEGMGYGPKEVKRILRRPRTIIGMASKNRVGRLRGYGNSVCAPVAIEFIKAYLEYEKRLE